MRHSWVLLALDGQRFGYPTERVQEVAVLRDADTRAVAGAGAHVRGVINLRGTVLPLFDLRKLAGFRGYLDEQRQLQEAFAQRKQDHISWLTELRASVVEGRRFTLTTDPHQCAFGRWYDAYVSPDPLLSFKLLLFDKPHQHIHSIGARCSELVSAGRQAEALKLIEQAWDVDLAILTTLFDQTLPLFKAIAREVVVVARSNVSAMGLVADAALEVCEVDDSDVQELQPSSSLNVPRELFVGCALRAGAPIYLFDADRLEQRLRE